MVQQGDQKSRRTGRQLDASGTPDRAGGGRPDGTPVVLHGTFLERPNRFVAKVRLEDGTERLVHVASSGRMTELLVPGASVVVRKAAHPGGKTDGLLSLVRHGETWVSVDTAMPGRLLREAFAMRTLAPFIQYTAVRPEYRYGDSRLDFLLTGPDVPPCLVEVKSVTSMVIEADGTRTGLFPDAPTDRGSRHLRELAAAVREGYRAAVCFVLQREDVTAFEPWVAVDPVFAATLQAVACAGVEVHAWRMRVNPEKIQLGDAVAVKI